MYNFKVGDIIHLPLLNIADMFRIESIHPDGVIASISQVVDHNKRAYLGPTLHRYAVLVVGGGDKKPKRNLPSWF